MDVHNEAGTETSSATNKNDQQNKIRSSKEVDNCETVIKVTLVNSRRWR